MKIALVILHADASRGGAERYTIDLAEGLVRRGHDVSLLATTFAGAHARAAQVKLAAGGATRLAQYKRFLGALDLRLGQVDYDVVHAMLPVHRCHLYHPHAGIAAESIESGHLKHRGQIGASISKFANRINPKRSYFARIERELLSGSQPPLVLCLSDYVKGAVRRHYPLLESRLFKLFNAVDLNRFDPSAHAGSRPPLREQLALREDHIVALMIAQDFARKGLSEALEALALASDDRLRLVVVGKEDPSPYVRLASRLGVRRRVVFAGKTSEPEAFYAASDFFLLPTRHDPCSLVVLEALAMGLPVITTRQNGASEMMTDPKEGIVLNDPSDVNAIARALRGMIEPEMRARMSAGALALRNSLSYEAHLDRVLEAYRLVTASAGEIPHPR